MSRKKARGAISDADKKLWQKVTESITELDSNQAATPLVRRSAYRVAAPDTNIGRTPARDLVEPSSSLRDADHNWLQKMRSGRVKPEGKIDLHGMTEDKAYAALNRYIEQAQGRGKRIILVITGKGSKKTDLGEMSHSDYVRGRGILKANVPRWLSQGELAMRVISYSYANARHGGDGALYVVLKRNRS